MDFEEFKDRVVKEIRKYLPERYEKAHVKLDTVRKLGSGYTSIRENAVKLALAGITTLEEILRVINEED
jgi:type II secretory ATPase GspE/PulE/Tfp pilus assembly ATPase PilB-like protein